MLGDEPHAPYERPGALEGRAHGRARGGRARAARARLLGGAPHRGAHGQSGRGARRRGPARDGRRRTRTLRAISYSRPAFGRGGSRPSPTGRASTTCARSGMPRRCGASCVPGARVVVAGAGFVGLEVASSAIALGAHVTVVGPGAAPFARTLGPEVGEWLGARARAAGVRLLTGRSVAGVERSADGCVRAVTLDDRSRCACDLVVVGAGATPNTELASGQVGLADLVWLLIGYIAFFAFSQGAVIWVFISEVFPNNIAKGQSLGTSSHWFMNALISGIFPLIAASSGGAPFRFLLTDDGAAGLRRTLPVSGDKGRVVRANATEVGYCLTGNAAFNCFLAYNFN